MSEAEEPEVTEVPMAPPLELPHALGVSRLVLSRGNLFTVTGASGNISPAGARELARP